MRPAVVVLGAIGTIEITTIRYVKTALQRFAVEETLTRFQNVIAGKFAANVFENLQAVWTGHTLSLTTISSRRNKGCRRNPPIWLRRSCRFQLTPLAKISGFRERSYFPRSERNQSADENAGGCARCA